MSIYTPNKMEKFATARSEDVNRELVKIQSAFEQLKAYVDNLALNPPDPVYLYTWRAYANSANGLIDFTTGEPGSRSYIGLAFNKLVETPSQIAEDYEWSPIGGVLGQFVSTDTLAVAGRPSATILTDLSSLANSLLAYQFDRQTLLDYVNARLFVEGEPVNTVIAHEQNERQTADTALAETIGLIGAKTPSGSAFILDLDKTWVSSTMSLGARLSNIQAAATNAQASIQTLQQTIAQANYAEASDLALLGAKTSDGQAFQMNLGTIKVSPTQSLSQYINQAVAGAAGNAASVSQIYDAVVTPTGGASAKAVLSLDVNGKVVGYTATNDGSTGAIRFKFNSFIIEDPSGNALFTAEAGVVKMHNVEVDTLKAGSVSTDSIVGNAVNKTAIMQRTSSISIPKSVTRDVMTKAFTKDSAGSYIEVLVFIPADSANDLWYKAVLYRNDVAVKTYKIIIIGDDIRETADAATLFHIDMGLPAGDYTYRLAITNQADWNADVVISADALMKITEVKR